MKKILVVEDDVISQKILRELLKNEYEMEVVNSGEEALEIMPIFNPDLILLDIMMPGIDGYETCQRIRENEDFKFVKILMVSAKSSARDRLKGVAVGANDYITIPFDNDELLVKIKSFLDLKFLEERKNYAN